jgi:predicted outer membrane repeat protein
MSGRKDRNMLAVFFAAMLVWAMCGPVAADTHYVSPGQSIQAAIDAASNGDEIEVAPGTYNEAIDFKGKAVRLYSSSGAEVTTIDGAGHYHVVQCVSGEGPGTIIEGFTITGGNASGSGTNGYGGGMYCESASPTVTNCTFHGNEAVRGGGLLNENGSRPTVTNCTFSANSASWNGGGMYNISNSSPILTNCTFTGNTASSDTYGGGAMFNHTNSNPTVTDCIFAANTATTNGGAIYNYNSSNPALTNCIFTANAAACQNGLRYEYYEGEWDNLPNFDALTPVKTGTVANFNLTPRNRDDNFGFRFTGYIYVQYPVAVAYPCFFYLKSDDGSKLYIDGAEVVDNDGLHGSREEIGVSMLLPGAHKIQVVYFEKSSAQLLEVSWSSSWWQKKLISQQELYQHASNGAGMYNYNSSPAVTNCTFSQNTANFNGGGMYCESGSPTVTNCIFWGDEPDEIFDDGASSTDVTYSNVEGGRAGTGNIDENPLLRHVAEGDLSLAPWSQCIDGGNNDVVPAGATDIAGMPRLVDGDCDATATVDMGAHEFRHAYGGDFDSSCLVNWADYAVLASAWLASPLSENWDPACDIGIPADEHIDCSDLDILAGNWLGAPDTPVTCDAGVLNEVFGLDAAAIFEILAAAPCSFSDDEILTKIAEAGCPMLELVEIDADASGEPAIPPGFHALGSYSFSTAGCQFAARELLPGVLASPEDYSQWLTDYWRPVPPTGYVSLGLVEKSVKPRLDEVKCVKQQLALPGWLGATVEPEKPHYPQHIVPHPLWTDGMNIGTFETLSPSLHVLDARLVQKPEYLTLQEVDQLIRDYGPVLKFHPEEDYYPDDPEWVLDNGVRLQWGLVYNEDDYDTFGQIYVNSMSTSSATLVDDVEYVVNTIKPNLPYYSSGSFKYWLNIPDALKPGDLARAKSLVRVVPWNHFFTEIQFWFFYPFNGPGRTRICLSSLWCEHLQLATNGGHYGDWEHVTLRFVNNTRKLESVYMSAHSGGYWFGPQDFGDALQFQGSHPIVYPAKYSHAHYPTAQTNYYHRVKSIYYWFGTFSVDLYDLTGNGLTLRTYLPDKYSIASYDACSVSVPDWLGFTARWGQYEKLRTIFRFDYGVDTYEYAYEEVGKGPSGPPEKRAWQVGISGEELGY